MAAAIDDGTMACVEETYGPPVGYGQYECAGTGLGSGSTTYDECNPGVTLREAEELFAVVASYAPGSVPSPVTPTPTPSRAGDVPTAGPVAGENPKRRNR